MQERQILALKILCEAMAPKNSKVLPVLSGVPQRSILSSMLFIILLMISLNLSSHQFCVSLMTLNYSGILTEIWLLQLSYNRILRKLKIGASLIDWASIQPKMSIFASVIVPLHVMAIPTIFLISHWLRSVSIRILVFFYQRI